MAGYMEKWCGMILDFFTKREGIMKKNGGNGRKRLKILFQRENSWVSGPREILVNRGRLICGILAAC
jgi:hypothetical protein